ncbi:MAG: response regulator [Candidatus Kerfeldbacteria bacterium]|nr:response regulator [Candidatus Kerfeldbacteria bacterium]
MSSQLKIILIEDEATLVSLYTVGLRSVGEVSAARNKAEALTLLQELIDTKVKPDVILLDLILPGAKSDALIFTDRVGFEVLHWLREQKWLELVPVIVMTNLDSTEDRIMAEKLGANGYIVKSNVVPKQIVEAIKAVI